MSNFTRLESSTNFIFVTVLSFALLVAGTPIVLSDDATMDSSTPASIVVVKPDGGRTWLLIVDAAPAVTEENFHCPEPMLKQFLPEAFTKNMGSYVWNVPEIESGEALIRVLDKLHPSISDVSDKPFAITQRVSDGWTMQSVGTSPGLISVSIVDDSIVWTSGWNGAVFRTTNGGSSWTQGASLPTHGTSIFGLNANTAFVCANFADDGRVYRTTDGGVSWTLVLQYTGSSASVLNVHMVDPNRGVAIGNPVGGLWRVFKTTNGGSTWDTLSRIPQPGVGYRDAVAWVGDQRGWFGTDGSLVYYTTNGGSTWTASDLGSLDVFSLVFPNEQLGLASTAFRYAFKTTDGGVSWSYVSTIPAPHPATIVSFITGIANPTPRWWATSLDEIYRSTNHGLSWTYETLADGRPFNDISMKHIQEKGLIVGYAVTAAPDGIVMRYSEIVTSTPEEPPNTLPLSVELYQNYPNPFNPRTNIRFEVPGLRFVSLKVYNVLGEEVGLLVNDVKQAGRHEVTWDAKGLPSGLYFYRLSTNSSTLTRKMLLIR
jgi:photosystem II stability/assembly factor-like uncharacterized protein